MNVWNLLEKIIIPVFASLGGAYFGAIMAFRYQRGYEKLKDKRGIIQILMMHRTAKAWELEWIKAMNVIDIVFIKDKKVINLFHKYIKQTVPGSPDHDQYPETLNQMIYEMAQCSGYKELTIENLKNVYTPETLLKHYENVLHNPFPNTYTHPSVSPQNMIQESTSQL